MSELMVPGELEEINSGKNARLLICYTCGTVNRLRDYQGDPNSDWELMEIIKRHLGEAVDGREEAHRSKLFVVDEEALDKMDDETLRKSLSDDLEVEIREFRNDFKDSAMKCYQLHARPKGGCSDWCTESRVIGRKVGIPPSERAYMCHYCPVSVWVENKKNEKSGMFRGLK